MKIIGLNENNQATPFIEVGDVLVLNGDEYVLQVIETKGETLKYNGLILQSPVIIDYCQVDRKEGHLTPLDMYNYYIKNFKVDIIKANRLELHII